jgi:type VI secretion system secreted protein VgrG
VARTLHTVFNVAGVTAEQVISFQERHTLGVPAELDVEFLLRSYQDIEALVGQKAALEFGYDGKGDTPRLFVGTVESATVRASPKTLQGGRTYQYSARVVSLVRLLDRNRETKIFQKMDVKDIVSKVLEDHGVPTSQQQWKLTGSYTKRDYCVQYQESALAFVSRLLEHEGIHFFSTFDAEHGETIVFADDSTTASPIDGDESIPYRSAKSGARAPVDAVHAARERRRVVSGKFTLRDYDFEKPSLDLTCDAAGSDDTDLAVYDYPGLYFEQAEGKRLAKTRLEAEQVGQKTVVIEADCPRISAGRKLKIAGSADVDGEYLVTRVVHDYEWGARPGEEHYTTATELIPGSAKFRPARVTPWPVIEGIQTARVVCPSGSQPEEIHTDEHGRVKVKFHWDLGPDTDDKATFWMRTSQLQTSGSMALPRLDWEVIVEYLEGNPDRPVISGRLYNGADMPPYALPEGKTRTSMKTVSTPGGGGSNEIRMEDKSGSEEISMRSQKDTNVTVANNKTKNVGNNETMHVGADSKMSVGANQTVKITKGSQNSIGAGQTVSIGGNRTVGVNAVTTLKVGGSSTTTVSGNQMEMDGNPLQALLALAAQKAAAYAAAQANQALASVDAAVQGKVNQVMGPINAATSQAQALGSGMQAVARGDLGAAGGLLAGAGALPGPAGFAAGLASGGGGGGASAAPAGPGGGGGREAARSGPPGGQGAAGPGGPAPAGGGMPSAGAISAQAMLGAAAGNAIQHGVNAAAGALGSALGLDSGGGGGGSQSNTAGPGGAVGGVDQTDRSKGPGHSTAKVAGKHSETVGTAKIMASLNGIITNIGGSATRTVSAANIALAWGNLAEAVGSKTEKAVGLVVLAKGNESESVKSSRMGMVGGAILEQIKGTHAVSAGANATLIGAFHKVEASSSITFKCGGSTLVIDGSGVTLKSPMVMLGASKIQLTKATAESG